MMAGSHSKAKSLFREPKSEQPWLSQWTTWKMNYGDLLIILVTLVIERSLNWFIASIGGDNSNHKSIELQSDVSDMNKYL